MKLPNLDNYNETVSSLRSALKPVGKIRTAGSEKLTNDLQWATIPTEYGATTGELNFGGELQFHYVDLKLKFVGENSFEVDVRGKSQADLMDEVYENLGMVQKTDEENDTDELKFDDAILKGYLAVQSAITELFDGIRDELKGYRSAVSLWPHGFDVSFLWFKSGNDEGSDPHVNFGFSPGFELGQPYIYFYAHPNPDGYKDIELPKGANWQDSWSSPGVQIPYSAILEQDDPLTWLRSELMRIYEESSQLL